MFVVEQPQFLVLAGFCRAFGVLDTMLPREIGPTTFDLAFDSVEVMQAHWLATDGHLALELEDRDLHPARVRFTASHRRGRYLIPTRACLEFTWNGVAAHVANAMQRNSPMRIKWGIACEQQVRLIENTNHYERMRHIYTFDLTNGK